MRALAISFPLGSSLAEAGFGGLLVVLGLTMGGCSRSALVDPQAPAMTDDPASGVIATAGSIATLHRRKCGNCHTRIEPGALPRATIEAAMVRHRRRAKLTEGQWVELIEFLSAAPAEPRHTASLP